MWNRLWGDFMSWQSTCWRIIGCVFLVFFQCSARYWLSRGRRVFVFQHTECCHNVTENIPNRLYTLLCPSAGSTLTTPPGLWTASSCGENTCSSHLCWTRSANTQNTYIHTVLQIHHSKCTCMYCIVISRLHILHAVNIEQVHWVDPKMMRMRVTYTHPHTLTSSGKTWHGIFFVALPSSLFLLSFISSLFSLSPNESTDLITSRLEV